MVTGMQVPPDGPSSSRKVRSKVTFLHRHLLGVEPIGVLGGELGVGAAQMQQ